MKFRLSTFLLLIALVSLATGWIVDRTLRKTNEEAIGDRERLATRIYETYRKGGSYLNCDPLDVHEEIKEDIVDSLLLLWKNESEFNKSYFAPDFYTSESMANSFLRMLDCDSPDSFRRFALSLYRYQSEATQQAYREKNNVRVASSMWYSGRGDPPPNETHYPQFHDKDSPEYASLEAFLERALLKD